MARSSAAGLEARLFVVRLEGKGPPGMALQLDGDPVAEEIVARGSFALAPGRHHLEMTAPGKRPTSVELTGAAGETRALTVALEDAPPPSSARIEESSGAAPPRLSAQKTWGFVLGAVGIAGLGVGGVFGGLALAKRLTLESESLDPSVGSARFYSDCSNADMLAAVLTAGFIAGGVALAAGATLLATAPTGKRSGWIRVGPYVGGGGTGLVAGGSSDSRRLDLVIVGGLRVAEAGDPGDVLLREPLEHDADARPGLAGRVPQPADPPRHDDRSVREAGPDDDRAADWKVAPRGDEDARVTDVSGQVRRRSATRSRRRG